MVLRRTAGERYAEREGEDEYADDIVDKRVSVVRTLMFAMLVCGVRSLAVEERTVAGGESVMAGPLLIAARGDGRRGEEEGTRVGT